MIEKNRCMNKEELLMSLIVSVYKGVKPTKRQSIDVMNFVSNDADLQCKINNSDWAAVRKHRGMPFLKIEDEKKRQLKAGGLK